MSDHRRAVAVRDLHARRRLLRAALASTGALVGWALARDALGTTPGDGTLFLLGLHLSAAAEGPLREVVPALLVATAAAAGALAVRAPAPRPDDDGPGVVAERPGLSVPWLAAGAVAAVHLPGPAIATLVVGGACLVLLAHRERTVLDPLLAVVGVAACAAAGATTARGVADGHALVVGGAPTVDGWSVLAPLPGRATAAAALVVALLLVTRCAGASRPRSGGSTHVVFLVAALGLVAGVGLTVLGEARWEFAWRQRDAGVFVAVLACAIAGLLVLGGWRERQRSLDADGATAATVLVAGAVALGLAGSSLAFVVAVAWFFRARGERPARWERGHPSRLAGRIRPAAWPRDRSTGARPKQPYGSTARGGGP